MSEIQSPGPTPREEQMYKREYSDGAALFEKALDHVSTCTYTPQKEKFDDVMNQAMDVLNNAARGLKRPDLIRQSEKISKDFQAYQKNPDAKHLKTLQHDLAEAQKTFPPKKQHGTG